MWKSGKQLEWVLKSTLLWRFLANQPDNRYCFVSLSGKAGQNTLKHCNLQRFSVFLFAYSIGNTLTNDVYVWAGDEWRCYNDEDVRVCFWEEVRKDQAYVLMYEAMWFTLLFVDKVFQLVEGCFL